MDVVREKQGEADNSGESRCRSYGLDGGRMSGAVLHCLFLKLSRKEGNYETACFRFVTRSNFCSWCSPTRQFPREVHSVN